MLKREFALDVSRLVWRSWSRRLATGIDRVCYAYLENFRDRAQAVVQYRGVQRVLSVEHSERLFDMLLDDDEKFKAKLLALAPRALACGKTKLDGNGAFYINVGHTDVDLDRLVRWVGESRLRAIYLIHDLIPMTHSEFCNPSSVNRHRGRVTNAITHAAGIITNSEASTRELERFAELEGLRTPRSWAPRWPRSSPPGSPARNSNGPALSRSRRRRISCASERSRHGRIITSCSRSGAGSRSGWAKARRSWSSSGKKARRQAMSKACSIGATSSATM